MSRPRPVRLLAATVAVLALALTGCGADDSGDASATDTTDSAGETGSSDAEVAPESGTTTELRVDGSATTAKCMVPNAEALATQTTAFEGTVTTLEDGMATLEVDRWFVGEETEQVTVVAPDEDLRALLVAVEFEVGRTYLVSATGDQVSLCGFTDEKSPELEALYAEAFAS